MEVVSTTGDRLHELIKRYLRSDFKPGCGCKDVVDKMNAHEPAWSLANQKYILDKLKDEGAKRHWTYAKILRYIPGSNAPLRWLLRKAVAMAEEDAKLALTKTGG